MRALPSLQITLAPLLSAALLAGAPGRPLAQQDSTTVVAGSHYAGSPLRERLLGRGYRQLWTTPVRVEVLDLGRFAGGLRPLRRGGGRQTVTLHLQGSDGYRYVFRGVDKSPGVGRRISDEGGLKAGEGIVRDLTSSLHPGANLIAAALEHAAGVGCAEPRLVVMPDDPALGEFRAEFAGVLGTIEERPGMAEDGASAFGGYDAVADTEEFLAALDSGSADRVDEQAYLRARLIDLLLGDWDRGYDQWRWGMRTTRDGRVWTPIPRDHDFALADFHGLAVGVARMYAPKAVRFDGEYRDLLGLTLSAQSLDRRLLSGLEWPAWEATAAALQDSLGEEAIRRAVRAAPPEWDAIAGERLTRTLLARRDRLGVVARRVYEQLATDVDVHGSHAAEFAEIVRPDRRTVEVRLYSRVPPGERLGQPYFRRTFRREETREVRVFLHGGGDEARVIGAGQGMTVRVIGGPGDDQLLDSTGPAVRGMAVTLHDDSGSNHIVARPGGRVDRKAFAAPAVDPLSGTPYRDWGWGRSYRPYVDHHLGVGAIVGAEVHVDRFGFRRAPFADRLSARGEYALGSNGFAVDLRGHFHRVNSGVEVMMHARASQIEAMRYFGLGNESAEVAGDDALVLQEVLLLEPALSLPFGRARISAGPVLRYTDGEVRPGSPLAADLPYGSGRFGQLGARARLELDRRDRDRLPRSGFLVTAEAAGYPAAWDAVRAFGRTEAAARAYFTLPVGTQPTVMVRAGGARAMGRYPIHEAAFLGGASTLHGYHSDRFAADGSLYGGAGVRLPLTVLTFPARATLGAHGMLETGRVFLAGESSDRWHTAAGGGLWYSVMVGGEPYTVSATYARGEIGRFYLRWGVPF